MQAMAGIRPSTNPIDGDGSRLLPTGVEATSMHGLGASLGSTVCVSAHHRHPLLAVAEVA